MKIEIGIFEILNVPFNKFGVLLILGPIWT